MNDRPCAPTCSVPFWFLGERKRRCPHQDRLPHYQRLRRWTDGTLVLPRDSNKLQLRDESNSQTIGSGKIESGSGGGRGVAAVTEGEEIRVGRYTVQVGERRLVSGKGEGRHPAVVDTATAAGLGGTAQRDQHRGQHAAGAGMAGLAARRAKFKAPAALNNTQPQQQQRQQPQRAAGLPQTRQRLGFRRPGPLLSSPAALDRADDQQQQQQHQQQQDEQRPVTTDAGVRNDGTETPSATPSLAKRRRPVLLPPAKRRPFVGPSRTNTPQPSSNSRTPASAAAQGVVPLDRGLGGCSNDVRVGAAIGIGFVTGAGSVAAGTTRGRKNGDDHAMPPFKLTFGGGGGTAGGCGEGVPKGFVESRAPSPLQQQQKQQVQKHQGREVSKPERERGKGGVGWPTRAVWVPNGFGDALDYRGVFSRAMQVHRVWGG